MHFCTMRAANAIGSGIEGFFGAFNFIRRNRMGWMFFAPVLQHYDFDMAASAIASSIRSRSN